MAEAKKRKNDDGYTESPVENPVGEYKERPLSEALATQEAEQK